MFSSAREGGRARSGVIVLPCGAGKTLTGIMAAVTLKRTVMVLCPSNMSVEQWRREVLQWTDLVASQIECVNAPLLLFLLLLVIVLVLMLILVFLMLTLLVLMLMLMWSPLHRRCFTSDPHSRVGYAGPRRNALAPVVLSTYSMISYGGARGERASRAMSMIGAATWGLLLLDEVHALPAESFRKVTESVHAHCKIGLSATLVREDERIADLHTLIGPKVNSFALVR